MIGAGLKIASIGCAPGFAWSQAPASRTVRMISNVEVFATARDDTRMLRSNFLISEFWGDETRVLTGWAGHRVVRDGGNG